MPARHWHPRPAAYERSHAGMRNDCPIRKHTDLMYACLVVMGTLLLEVMLEVFPEKDGGLQAVGTLGDIQVIGAIGMFPDNATCSDWTTNFFLPACTHCACPGRQCYKFRLDS